MRQFKSILMALTLAQLRLSKAGEAGKIKK